MKKTSTITNDSQCSLFDLFAEETETLTAKSNGGSQPKKAQPKKASSEKTQTKTKPVETPKESSAKSTSKKSRQRKPTADTSVPPKSNASKKSTPKKTVPVETAKKPTMNDNTEGVTNHNVTPLDTKYLEVLCNVTDSSATKRDAKPAKCMKTIWKPDKWKVLDVVGLRDNEAVLRVQIGTVKYPDANDADELKVSLSKSVLDSLKVPIPKHILSNISTPKGEQRS